MTYGLIALLIVINAVGIALKMYTRRKKQAMDGVSDVYTSEQIDGNVIGKL